MEPIGYPRGHALAPHAPRPGPLVRRHDERAPRMRTRARHSRAGRDGTHRVRRTDRFDGADGGRRERRARRVGGAASGRALCGGRCRKLLDAEVGVRELERVSRGEGLHGEKDLSTGRVVHRCCEAVSLSERGAIVPHDRHSKGRRGMRLPRSREDATVPASDGVQPSAAAHGEGRLPGRLRDWSSPRFAPILGGTRELLDTVTVRRKAWSAGAPSPSSCS